MKSGYQILSEKIYRDLIDKDLSPGDSYMTETQVAQTFKVSKVQAREAISHLKSMGIVKGLQSKGLVVSKSDVFRLLEEGLPFFITGPKEWAHLAELRYSLEIGAVDLILARSDAESCDELESCLDEGFRVLENQQDLPAWIDADANFHKKLISMAGSPFVASMGRVLNTYFLNEKNRLKFCPAEVHLERKTFDEHRQIVNAVRDKKADRLRVFLQVHLEPLIHQFERP